MISLETIETYDAYRHISTNNYVMIFIKISSCSNKYHFNIMSYLNNAYKTNLMLTVFIFNNHFLQHVLYKKFVIINSYVLCSKIKKNRVLRIAFFYSPPFITCHIQCSECWSWVNNLNFN